ncbi:zinc finger matrin-type protein CG9776 [Spodoptera frugiperda]|uniref:Zinc finger matrin-type protein CG9776 n=1 Tax=Spodoptera frugiperda TaxID=7108 RepID=A0A9R0F612_SPOFR|nr:zinc finger matrin-type protein CG9776 [Spodoptera frugiperda]
MSRDHRKDGRFYNREREWDRDRDRERDRDRNRDRDRDLRDPRDYRSRPMHKRSRTPPRRDDSDKRRSRSPRAKNDKDLLDENILSEISKLPEPSELWDNQQFQDNVGFQQPPPGFPPPEGVPPLATAPNYNANYQPSYSGIYDDFPSVGAVPQPPIPPDMSAWNQMSLPPPPQQPPAPFINNVEDQIKKEAAIESEMRHQKAALSKQREDYIKKANILKKEMETLKDQRNELRGDAKRSPSPDTKRFLKENTKLQLEIQNKLKTIYNVVDMLNGIIGEEAHEIADEDNDNASERNSKRKSRSPSNKKFNYVYYDPEMHWCRVCNEFPPTAKDYLNHLHSPAHHKMAAAHMEAPWHTVSGVNEGFPSFPAAPTKRTPIKGLQFFVPSTAWYCKLCDQFIGDLHCASAHLKSVVHSKNYTNFVEQNPHWETDWMSDRQKAFEKSRANKGKSDEKPAQYTAHTITFNKDGFHTKHKESPAPPEEKKKKDKKKKSKRKSSSSSSSESSSSDSEPVKKKKAKAKKQRSKLEGRDDKTLTEWMSNIQMDRLNDNDRKLLDTLKSRMKKEKTDEGRSPDRSDRERNIAELSRKMRESERRETRAREDRDRRDDMRRRDDRRDEQRDRDTTPRLDTKKPEIRKMPFIGKMPVYKHLGKNSKTEEQKKEELKKKEEEETTKKRREEMDAEIQKKVAEFKEKIARAQLERQAQVELAPPALALPTALAAPAPAMPYLPPQPTPAPPQLMQQTPQPPQQPTLPKDFQDALDIIFPTEVKPDLSQGDGLFPLPPGFVPGLGGVMPPFPPLPLMQTQMTQMFGFDLNAPLFQPRPQLYDTHVPLVPSPKPRPQHNKKRQQQQQHKPDQRPKHEPPQKPTEEEKNGNIAKKKEEMDDLAMLGIDASDVGCL